MRRAPLTRTPNHENGYKARTGSILTVNGGFTLVEMLAAIAIFSLVSLSAWQLLQGVMSAAAVSGQHHSRLQAVEYAMLLMEQDFRQIVDRGARVENAISSQSLFSSRHMLDSDDEAIAFVRAGWRNPGQQLPRSELQRVSYRLKDGELERLHHYVLDPNNAEPVVRKLLDGITSLRFRFYANGAWQDQLNDDGEFPEGLSISFEHDVFGVIERRFLLVDNWPGQEVKS